MLLAFFIPFVEDGTDYLMTPPLMADLASKV